MYRYEDIKQVDLELTERCNAACPMCPRTFRGSSILNPKLDNSEISLKDAKRIFTPSFIGQLEQVDFNGNYGDPIVASDSLEIIKYFRENNNTCKIFVHTNGGARSTSWWIDLANALGPKGEVIFSIDGLQDTNHIYRQHVNWKILERSFKTFISAGGKARWSFIIFKHNEHQVEEARALAQSHGFNDFNAKKTLRFRGEKQYISFDSINKKVFALKPAADISQEPIDNSSKNFSKSNPSIDCYAVRDKTIHISAKQILHPCCHLYTSNYGCTIDNSELDLKVYSIKDILNSNKFAKIKNSWNDYENSELGCKMHCTSYNNQKSLRTKTAINNITVFN